MPVALVTLHAYRSWSEASPRGYVQRGESGVQRANKRLAAARAARALAPPARFDEAQRGFILDEARDIARRRRWRLHAGSCTGTHVHLVVSWRSSDIEEKQVERVRRSRAGTGAALPGGASGGASGRRRLRRDDEVEYVMWKFKELLGMRLSQREGTVGNHWFSRGDHDRWVRDLRHLLFLRSRYLPRHRGQGGVVRDFDAEGARGGNG